MDPPVARLFSAEEVRAILRRFRDRCARLGVEGRAGFHAFRRGRAQDMLRWGDTLAAIITAGDWNSNAFIKYLKQGDVEEALMVENLIQQSDSDPE